jgi:bifunctional UDP-N-acetylglucosamine pyrophosphorylase/glucosamine-1-phosphate N-acetyltransferase
MLAVMILAGGKSSRTKTSTSKVFLPLLGMCVIEHVIKVAKEFNPKQIVGVFSPSSNTYACLDDLTLVYQDLPLGTGHAFMQGLNHLDSKIDDILVLCGDMPLIQHHFIEQLLKDHRDRNADVTVMGMQLPMDQIHSPYGRMILDHQGNFEEIVEWKDATPQQKFLRLVHTGVMVIKCSVAQSIIYQIQNHNKAKEYYLTDIVKAVRKEGGQAHYSVGDFNDFQGVNTLQELAMATNILQDRLRLQMMESGVLMVDPKTVYLQMDTKIEADCVVEPFVVFGPKVWVQSKSHILSYCHIEDTIIEKGSVVGPFARLRSGCHLGQGCEVGNFVELKKSVFSSHTKVKHLSYIGDCTVGSRTNIGAGTISCNYDGYQKHSSRIGDEVFIGANTTLVSPVCIGNGAIIGAGSVITKDVKQNNLALSRSEQVEKEEGAHRYRHKKKYPQPHD